MGRTARMLILMVGVGSYCLAGTTRADGIRSYAGVVDLGAQKYDSITTFPRFDEQGNIGQIKQNSGGNFRLELIDPNHNGHFTGWTLHKTGEATNLLPSELNGVINPLYLASTTGHIVGNEVDKHFAPIFFSPETGRVTQLTHLTGAAGQVSVYSVNTLDEIVGTQDGKAIYYASPSSEPVDLASMLPKATGWHFILASDINDRGEVIGYGINPAGKEAVFKLIPTASPVPEPTTMAFFAVAGIWIAMSSRSRKI